MNPLTKIIIWETKARPVPSSISFQLSIDPPPLEVIAHYLAKPGGYGLIEKSLSVEVNVEVNKEKTLRKPWDIVYSQYT